MHYDCFEDRMAFLVTCLASLSVLTACGTHDPVAATDQGAAPSTQSVGGASQSISDVQSKQVLSASDVTSVTVDGGTGGASALLPSGQVQAASSSTSPVESSTGTSSLAADAQTASTPGTSTAPLASGASVVSTATSPASPTSSRSAAATPPLVYKDNLSYVGAFRFPQLPYTGNVCDGFTYGGASLAFNPSGDGGKGTLFASAHAWCSYVGEISIPAPTQATNIAGLQAAQLLNSVSLGRIGDPLEGALASSGITGGVAPGLTGLLVAGGNLVMSAASQYGWTQPVSHWSRPLDLSVSGQVSPPSKVAGPSPYDNPRYLAGYMCDVPADLQAALGGKAITGLVPDSIVSTSSNGPSAFAFEPSSVGRSSDVVATPLLFYPVGNPLESSVIGQSQSVWNWTSLTRGCAIPNGTRSLLYIGRHGIGSFDYGVGGTSGYSTDGAARPIYDPADQSTGEHAWPYRYQVWAYDTSELSQVKAGSVKPYQVRPYSVWSFSLPFSNPNGQNPLGGMAYDPSTKRLFIVQNEAGAYGEALIHVFKIDVASIPR